MARVNITLTGAQDLARRVGVLADKTLPGRVHSSVSSGAKRIERAAKENTRGVFANPTGETERRIKVFLDRGGPRGAIAMIGVVGEGFSQTTGVGGTWDRAPIGFFQEYGFLHGSRKKPNRKKVPAKPFLRPALDDNKNHIKRDIRMAVEGAIRKI